jgi:hypothetical protein
MQHPEDLDNLILEGSFETYSNPQIWNIQSLDIYNLIRRPTDHTFSKRSESYSTGWLIAWQEVQFCLQNDERIVPHTHTQSNFLSLITSHFVFFHPCFSFRQSILLARKVILQRIPAGVPAYLNYKRDNQ